MPALIDLDMMFCVATVSIWLSLLLKFVAYVCLLLLGCLIFLLGQWILGWQREGGVRLVLFCAGVFLMAAGTGLIYAVIRFDLISQNYIFALLLLLAGVLCLYGMALTGVSIMGSNERVRAWLDDLHRTFRRSVN